MLYTRKVKEKIENRYVWRRLVVFYLVNRHDMTIIKHPSKQFNLTDQQAYNNFSKSVDITDVLCRHCPHRKNCPDPHAIFFGFYKHKVYKVIEKESVEYTKKQSYRTIKTKKILQIIKILIIQYIYVQRIMGKGCGETHSLVPSFHVPYHPFSLEAVKEIIDNYDSSESDFFDFDDASLMRTIIRLKNNIDTGILDLKY